MTTTLAALIGMHPAALRSVSWDELPLQTLAHLELETKHGHVAVFDHRAPVVHANPPRPPDASPHAGRRWLDLTEQVPSAFDGRPTIRAIEQAEREGQPCWHIRLSTGVALAFVLHASKPLLLAL